jgi:hypothetical protein
MAWNGLGQYLLNALYTPEVNGNIVDAPRYNGALNDIAAGITAALAKNGENVPTANLPMGGYKHTGAGEARASGQYLTFDQATSLYIPWTEKSTDYTLILTDAGKGFCHPLTDANNRTFTIPSNAAVPMPHGGEGYATAITFVNLSVNDLTIAITTDTLLLAGVGSTGSRTLAQSGLATALKISATQWIISGTGLS